MTPQSQEPPQGQRAKCPYCGCGFIPARPGQEYCSVFCERQDAIDAERHRNWPPSS